MEIVDMHVECLGTEHSFAFISICFFYVYRICKVVFFSAMLLISNVFYANGYMFNSIVVLLKAKYIINEHNANQFLIFFLSIW